MSYQHKRSSVAGKVPTPANFKQGEIIVNTADGKLYMLVGTTVKSFSMDEAINLLLDGKQDKLSFTPLNKAGDIADNLKTSTTPTANDHVARKDYVDGKVGGIIPTVAAGNVRCPAGDDLVGKTYVTILASGRVNLYHTFTGSVASKRRLYLHRVNPDGTYTQLQDSGEKSGGTAAVVNLQVDVVYGDTFLVAETIQRTTIATIRVTSDKIIPVIF